MSNTSFTIDSRSFNRAMREFSTVTKRGLVDVGLAAAKGFVKNAAAITPPGKGSLVGAKQRGQAAVAGDIAKILVGVTRKSDLNNRSGSPAEIHARFRSRSTGRVNPRRLRDKHRVGRGELTAYRRKMMGHVGKLAAGWNAAAQKLGLRLPEWISRHGQGRGGVSVMISSGGLTISMQNKVPFIGNVRGLNSRVQSALRYQERSMMRQVAHLLEKARKRAFR